MSFRNVTAAMAVAERNFGIPLDRGWICACLERHHFFDLAAVLPFPFRNISAFRSFSLLNSSIHWSNVRLLTFGTCTVRSSQSAASPPKKRSEEHTSELPVT